MPVGDLEEEESSGFKCKFQLLFEERREEKKVEAVRSVIEEGRRRKLSLCTLSL